MPVLPSFHGKDGFQTAADILGPANAPSVASHAVGVSNQGVVTALGGDMVGVGQACIDRSVQVQAALRIGDQTRDAYDCPKRYQKTPFHRIVQHDESVGSRKSGFARIDHRK
jgi:hypothetical protein